MPRYLTSCIPLLFFELVLGVVKFVGRVLGIRAMLSSIHFEELRLNNLNSIQILISLLVNVASMIQVAFSFRIDDLHVEGFFLDNLSARVYHVLSVVV